jgi:NAD(P)-dependent dehydrogenase (short-subunit alcohol dehydrogenase family)
MASLANKVGIVTGGGTGIGRATALAMARAGASLVIGNRGAKLGEEVVRERELENSLRQWNYSPPQRGRSRLTPNESSHLR